MKRILFFDLVGHFGGAQRSTLELLTAVSDAHAVRVVDAYGAVPQYRRRAQTAGLDYVVLLPEAQFQRIGGSGLRRVFRGIASLPGAIRVCLLLRNEIRRFRPDAIQVISPKALVYALLASAGLSIPVMAWARGGRAQDLTVRLATLGLVDAVVCLSETTRDASIAAGAPNARTVVVSNFLSREMQALNSAARKNAWAPSGRPAAFLPATLLPAKGQACAIAAISELRAKGVYVHLYLAGDDPDPEQSHATELAALASSLGVSELIHFLGWRDDVPYIMGSSDMLIVASHSEGMPRVILEAMASGVPVIATPVGSVPEMLDGGRAGWLVPVGDATALAHAIQSVVGDPASRNSRVHFAQATVNARYTADITRKQFAQAVALAAMSTDSAER